MKKFMFVVVALLSFLFSFNVVHADVKLETEETAAGSIKIKLVFEQGYVGAVDTSIKVQGNVNVDNLIWNSSLNAYVKRYSYDANSKTVRIIISTGDSSKNLLDKFGVLYVGELKLSNSTNESQSYSFSVNNVSMVNADYKTNAKLDASDSNLGEYVIKVDDPVTPDKPIVPDYNGDDDGSVGNDYSPINPDNDDSRDDQIENDEDDDEFLDEDQDLDEEEIRKPIINDDKNSDNKNEDSNDAKTHNQKIVRYLWIILGSLIVVAIILAGIYAKKQNKLNKMQ